MKKIIIYGGSFNPFHNGHDAIVRYCASLNDYDEVWIMPSARRADKPGLLNDNLRLEMLWQYKRSLVCSGSERVKVSDFEIALGAPSETIRTYRALQKHYPNHQFTFIFGADAVADMPSWRSGQQLLQELLIMVVERAGALPFHGVQKYPVAYIPKEVAGISSTQIRQKLKNGRQISDSVPPAIDDFINKEQQEYNILLWSL